MQIIDATAISGVLIRKLQMHTDNRGWLLECFREDEIERDIMPVMSYVSMTVPGVARGPHEHLHQTDYFCFMGSSRFIVYLWDNRKESPTYGRKAVLTLQEDEPVAIIVPPGVVHAYKNTGSNPGLVMNFPNKLFAGHDKKDKIDEVRYENDPASSFVIEEGK